MRQAGRNFTAKSGREVSDHLIETGVRLRAVEQFDEVAAKNMILLRKILLKGHKENRPLITRS